MWIRSEDENLVRLHGRHEDGSEVILSSGRLFIAAGAVRLRG